MQLKNNLLLAWRSIRRHKGFSAINIVGLSVALAVAMLMLLWVQDEWQKDKCFANGNQLFRVKRVVTFPDGKKDVYQSIPYPMLVSAAEEMPEVEAWLPIGYMPDLTLIHKQDQFTCQGNVANEDYFGAFSLDILEGEIDQFEEQEDALALSYSMAERIFGESHLQNAIGQPIELFNYGQFVVKAIYADYPSAASERNDFLFSFAAFARENTWLNNWTNNGMQGVLRVRSDADLATLAQKLTQGYHEQQRAFTENAGNAESGLIDVILQPYADHYLYREYNQQLEADDGRIAYVRTFGIAALALLLISCINFVNLATARASLRAKEVGVRKTVGAPRSALVGQFMTEALLVTIISVGGGLLLAKLLLPQANLLAEKTLVFDFSSAQLWLSIGGIVLLTTLLSGLYPAFVLSGFRPLHAIRSGQTVSGANSGWLRQGLVVTQFALSLLLIVGALTVRQQIAFIQNRDLGLNKEHLIEFERGALVQEKWDVVKTQIAQAPGVESVVASSQNLIQLNSSTSYLNWPGKTEDQAHENLFVVTAGPELLDVFKIDLLEGEYYRPGELRDTTKIVLNAAAVDMMDLADPLGAVIDVWGTPWQVVGVVEDFHNRSVHGAINPVGLILDTRDPWRYFVRIQPGESDVALAQLQRIYSETLPGVPFDYQFVDDTFQAQFANESLMGNLAKYFSAISLFISCLGLLGLAAFAARQRTKEIGIRKVLGASVSQIVSRLLRSFLKPVLIGVALAIPLAWYAMQWWLEDFVYRIDFNWSLLGLAGVVAIGVAILTVSFQSLRAAVANPVDSLRSE